MENFIGLTSADLFTMNSIKKMIIFVLHHFWYLGHTFFGAADRGHFSARRLGSYRPNFFLNMKNIFFLLLIPLLACDRSEETVSEYGTHFRLNNNTYGVNDFRIQDSGRFPIRFGSIDFGRNLCASEELYPDYNDSIGYLYLDGHGSGVIHITNQDTIPQCWTFTYTWGKRSQNYQFLTITFDERRAVTWTRNEPLYVFGYEKVGKYWRYESCMSRYSGEWKWAGNHFSIR